MAGSIKIQPLWVNIKIVGNNTIQANLDHLKLLIITRRFCQTLYIDIGVCLKYSVSIDIISIVLVIVTKTICSQL